MRLGEIRESLDGSAPDRRVISWFNHNTDLPHPLYDVKINADESLDVGRSLTFSDNVKKIPYQLNTIDGSLTGGRDLESCKNFPKNCKHLYLKTCKITSLDGMNTTFFDFDSHCVFPESMINFTGIHDHVSGVRRLTFGSYNVKNILGIAFIEGLRSVQGLPPAAAKAINKMIESENKNKHARLLELQEGLLEAGFDEMAEL